MTALEKHLITLQQKLEHLNTEVATLIALTTSEKNMTTLTDISVKRPVTSPALHSPKSSVGINRYHQLQLNE